MQITVCDRCGKTFSPIDKGEVIFWITVEEIVTESDKALKARRILDLCYSCRKSLSDWYKDGSQYKIRGLKMANLKWKPVTPKTMPEDGQEVVAHVKYDGGYNEVCVFEKEKERWWGAECWYSNKAITRWFPIPKDEKEGDGDA